MENWRTRVQTESNMHRLQVLISIFNMYTCRVFDWSARLHVQRAIINRGKLFSRSFKQGLTLKMVGCKKLDSFCTFNCLDWGELINDKRIGDGCGAIMARIEDGRQLVEWSSLPSKVVETQVRNFNRSRLILRHVPSHVCNYASQFIHSNQYQL